MTRGARTEMGRLGVIFAFRPEAVVVHENGMTFGRQLNL